MVHGQRTGRRISTNYEDTNEFKFNEMNIDEYNGKLRGSLLNT